MSPSTSVAWTVPRTRGNTCTAADGEGESRWGGERVDGEGREQGGEGNSTGEIAALIFDVHMNILAVAWLC